MTTPLQLRTALRESEKNEMPVVQNGELKLRVKDIDVLHVLRPVEGFERKCWVREGEEHVVYRQSKFV